MEADRVYFSRRADEERIKALQAGDVRARQAHMELAARYDQLANADVSGGAGIPAPPARASLIR